MPTGLYDRPTLVLDPGMHTADDQSVRTSMPSGRYIVTGSDDRDGAGLVGGGRPAAAHHPPAGRAGKCRQGLRRGDQPGRRSSSQSGGWMRSSSEDRSDLIYLFDRVTGAMAGRIDGLPNIVVLTSPSRRMGATSRQRSMVEWVFASTTATTGWAEVARDTDYGDAELLAPISRPTAGWRRRATTATSGCTIDSFQLDREGARTAGGRAALRHRLQPRRDEARCRLR